MKKPLLYLLLPLLFACGAEQSGTADTTPKVEVPREVNIYTHRHYDVDKELFARFTELTGIKVNVVQADADELMTRLESEGSNSPCDMLITADAGRLGLAKQRGLLRAVSSEKLTANIPANLRDPAGQWYGLTMRARVLVYDKTKVKPEELSSYAALTQPRFRKKVLVRSSGNIYNQSLLAAMIAHDGREAAKKWAAGVVQNMAREPKGNDTEQIMSVSAGLGEVAIVNSYYVAKVFSSDEAEKMEAAKKLAVAFPDMNGHGTHVNVSGAGITTHAPHAAAATELLEFLSSNEAQSRFAEGNMEYPVLQGVAPAAILGSWGGFKPDALDLSELARNNAEATMVFDEVGWK